MLLKSLTAQGNSMARTVSPSYQEVGLKSKSVYPVKEETIQPQS